ncbi:MAG: acetylglutamate kinase [Deltaproteobacteria bacterium]|nr:acetylglutamate kinase [Deltaproteobacteria bacterium]
MAGRIVIKVGGSLLDDEARQRAIATQVAALAGAGHSVAVVHGGGKHLTALLKRLGIESRFHDGLRVTSAEVMDAALMTLSGSVNRRLVASFVASGLRAIGLCGGDAGFVRAERLAHPSVDYGYTGVVRSVDAAIVDVLIDRGFLPVIACVAIGPDHRYYNVNADQMAAACAVAFKADRLVFLTDVDGVADADRRLIPRLDPGTVRNLIAAKIVTGGMLPKLGACLDALKGGVPGISILNGSASDCLDRAVARGEAVGTAICQGA